MKKLVCTIAVGFVLLGALDVSAAGSASMATPRASDAWLAVGDAPAFTGMTADFTAPAGAWDGALAIATTETGFAAPSGAWDGALAIATTETGFAASAGAWDGALAIATARAGFAAPSGAWDGTLANATTGAGFAAPSGAWDGALAIATAETGFAAPAGAWDGTPVACKSAGSRSAYLARGQFAAAEQVAAANRAFDNGAAAARASENAIATLAV